MDPDHLHPYVPICLEPVLWLPDGITGQAAATLVAGNKPAYRLTPAVYEALFQNVCRLEERWVGTPEGLTVERREALVRAAGVLRELWEWLVVESPTGTVATEPPALPDVRALAREVGALDRVWDPRVPVPATSMHGPVNIPVGSVRVARQRRTAARSKARAKGSGDAIVGRKGTDGGLFGEVTP